MNFTDTKPSFSRRFIYMQSKGDAVNVNVFVKNSTNFKKVPLWKQITLLYPHC